MCACVRTLCVYVCVCVCVRVCDVRKCVTMFHSKCISVDEISMIFIRTTNLKTFNS